MGFPRQEYWSGPACPPPGDLPDLGIEPASPALQVGSLLMSLHRRFWPEGPGFRPQANASFKCGGSISKVIPPPQASRLLLPASHLGLAIPQHLSRTHSSGSDRYSSTFLVSGPVLGAGFSSDGTDMIPPGISARAKILCVHYFFAPGSDTKANHPSQFNRRTLHRPSEDSLLFYFTISPLCL